MKNKARLRKVYALIIEERVTEEMFSEYEWFITQEYRSDSRGVATLSEDEAEAFLASNHHLLPSGYNENDSVSARTAAILRMMFTTPESPDDE